MVRLLTRFSIALSLLFAVFVAPRPAVAGFSPGACLTVGGYNFYDCTTLKTLTAHVSATGTYYTFRDMNGSAGYTPSGLNNFRVYAVSGQASGGTYGVGTLLETNIDLGDGAGGTPTTFYPGNFGTTGGDTFLFDFKAMGGPLGAGQTAFGKGGLLVHNTKYLSALAGQALGAFIYVYGYEEP